MRGTILAAAAAGVVLLGGCGGGSDGEAVAALKRQFELLSDGQLGRFYETLHPEQRPLIDRELFINCYTELGAIDVEVTDVKDEYQEEVTIPGTSGPRTATALTVTIEGVIGGRPAQDTDTFHVYEVGGAWYWALGEEPFMAMAAGECF